MRDLGLYGQEELLLMDRRLLLTAGLRADRSSNNGDTGKFFFYPKAAVSYRLIRPFGGLDEIKLRGAFGQTGNQPLFGPSSRPIPPARSAGSSACFPATGRATRPSSRSGRPSSRPASTPSSPTDGPSSTSRSTSGPSATCCWSRRWRPASGRRPGSSAPTASCGIAASRSRSPSRRSRRERLNWLFRTTFFANRSKITRLDVPAFETGGFGTSLGAFLIEEGSSATQIVGHRGRGRRRHPRLPDVLLQRPGRRARSRFGFLWDWKQGGDVINLTEFLYDLGQNSIDYVEAGGGALIATLGRRQSRRPTCRTARTSSCAR